MRGRRRVTSPDRVLPGLVGAGPVAAGLQPTTAQRLLWDRQAPAPHSVGAGEGLRAPASPAFLVARFLRWRTRQTTTPATTTRTTTAVPRPRALSTVA